MASYNDRDEGRYNARHGDREAHGSRGRFERDMKPRDYSPRKGTRRSKYDDSEDEAGIPDSYHNQHSNGKGHREDLYRHRERDVVNCDRRRDGRRDRSEHKSSVERDHHYSTRERHDRSDRRSQWEQPGGNGDDDWAKADDQFGGRRPQGSRPDYDDRGRPQYDAEPVRRRRDYEPRRDRHRDDDGEYGYRSGRGGRDDDDHAGYGSRRGYDRDGDYSRHNDVMPRRDHDEPRRRRGGDDIDPSDRFDDYRSDRKRVDAFGDKFGGHDFEPAQDFGRDDNRQQKKFSGGEAANSWNDRGQGGRGADSWNERGHGGRGGADNWDSAGRGADTWNSGGHGGVSGGERRDGGAPARREDFTDLATSLYQRADLTLDGLVPFQKDFYVEHALTKSMSFEQAQKYRLDNFIKILPPTKAEDVPNPIVAFSVTCFGPVIQNVIDKKGFKQPTPIQMQGWPIACSGMDIIGIAQTGSGKTLAFILPALIHALGQPPLGPGEGPIVLVLAPTRELALQIYTETLPFAEATSEKIVAIYGQMGPPGPVYRALEEGVHIVVGCPGRVMDFIEHGKLSLKRVTYFVLDEADRLLDMGFEPQIAAIEKNIRPDRQVLMWSATWPRQVENLARRLFDKRCNRERPPVHIQVGSKDHAVSTITQEFVLCKNFMDKKRLFFEHLERTAHMLTLVFAKTKKTVDTLTSDAPHSTQGRVFAAKLHGDMEQPARISSLGSFRRKEKNCMIATQVASRGLDIENIAQVVVFDPPQSLEDYIHMIGRTGRAGKRGASITFIMEEELYSPTHFLKNVAASLAEIGTQTIPDWLPNAAAAKAHEMKILDDDDVGRQYRRPDQPLMAGRSNHGGFSAGGGGGRNTWDQSGGRDWNSRGASGAWGDEPAVAAKNNSAWDQSNNGFDGAAWADATDVRGSPAEPGEISRHEEPAVPAFDLSAWGGGGTEEDNAHDAANDVHNDFATGADAEDDFDSSNWADPEDSGDIKIPASFQSTAPDDTIGV